MFRFIFRIIIIILIFSLVFTALSFWKCGGWLRYLGNTSYSVLMKLSDLSDKIYNCRKKTVHHYKGLIEKVFNNDEKRDSKDN